MPPSVCLIIVTHDSADVLPRCLDAVAAQTHLPDAVLVIDSGSGDGSAALAERHIEATAALAGRATVLRAAGNVGFAAANNLGIAQAGTELVALLNPDAFPEPDWLAALLAAADRHPEAAAFGSLQLCADRPDMVDGCGDVYHVSGLSWRSGHRRSLPTAEAEVPPRCVARAALEAREIFSACAAAALYRRDAVLAVGGFDEDFFCYFEDVDLGFRMRLAGHAARHVPAAVVEHLGGASSGDRPGDFAVYHGHRNLVWCFVKNMPLPLFAGLLIPHLAQTMVSLTVWIVRGRAGAFLRAKRDAVGGLGSCLRKRRQVRRAVSWRRIWCVLDAGWWRT